MKIKFYILIILGSLFLNNCFDLSEKTYWSDGNYAVWNNPGNNHKTLYFKLDTGNGIGRVNSVSQIGSNKKIIIIESSSLSGNVKKYWILNKEKDNEFYNSDEIIEGPYNSIEFKNRKVELNITNLEFSKTFKE